jgi:hypothetical protein
MMSLDQHKLHSSYLFTLNSTVTLHFCDNYFEKLSLALQAWPYFEIHEQGSALTIACLAHQIVRQLLDAHADSNARDKDGPALSRQVFRSPRNASHSCMGA